jgi:hypothetical protein
MNCVGTTISVPSPGIQGSTLGIRADDLFVAHVEAARDVGEGVFLGALRDLHGADDILVRHELEFMRRHRHRQFRHHGLRRRGFGHLLVLAPRAVHQGTRRQQHAGHQERANSADRHCGLHAVDYAS